MCIRDSIAHLARLSGSLRSKGHHLPKRMDPCIRSPARYDPQPWLSEDPLQGGLHLSLDCGLPRLHLPPGKVCPVVLETESPGVHGLAVDLEAG